MNQLKRKLTVSLLIVTFAGFLAGFYYGDKK